VNVDLNSRCTPCRWTTSLPRAGCEDGRLLHDFFLAEVKAPSESAAPWDYYKIRRMIRRRRRPSRSRNRSARSSDSSAPCLDASPRLQRPPHLYPGP
jgi:hypothetical protein